MDMLAPPSTQRSRKWPAFNDSILIMVTTGSRVSQLLTKREGIGSSGQDFNAELWISDLILFVDKVLNANNDGVDVVVLSTVMDAETVKSMISASICLWIAYWGVTLTLGTTIWNFSALISSKLITCTGHITCYHISLISRLFYSLNNILKLTWTHSI